MNAFEIPENFITFLESLSFKPCKVGERPIANILAATLASTAHGETYIEPSAFLYQQEHTQVTIKEFRQTLLRLLRKANHVATDAIADSILGCAVGAASSGADRTAFLSDLMGRFRTAESSHFFIFPDPAVTERVNIEGYRLGEIDLPVLTSRCNRAQSDYAQLYAKQLSGRVCLQSPEFHHVVIDFIKPGLDRRLLAIETWRNLLLNYFEQVSRQHFEFMWSHLDRTQMLATPFGSNLTDVQKLRHGSGMFADKVTIYLDFSQIKYAGYVVPEKGVSVFHHLRPNSEAMASFIQHRKNYRLSEVGDSELGRTLFACAGFCQQAIRFLEAGRTDDAALYATICLEHLFNEQIATSKAVSTRTAAVTYLRLAPSYTEAKKEVRTLYDARSAFVHSGASVTPTQAERLIVYASETVRSMLVLHLNPENRLPGFKAKWVKKLDWIVAGFEAGLTFDPSTLADSGIFKS